MQSLIKEEIGVSLSQQEMAEFFKKLFPIGDPSALAETFFSSLSDKTPEGLCELILSCRNSRREFAKWIFNFVVLTNTPKTETDPSNGESVDSPNPLSSSLQNMTAISSSSPVPSPPCSQDEFIAFCLSSKLFLKSWNVLRLCAF
ncbi:hypothetical protein NEMIN01_1012 [Nematocida minor]|uniref:uncharacterized protein n=1 Tax=Nematocida minor TaxID=1912983 RepID=UPI002220173E|nr:uncharacterized protein NEMIN01_1012 [Nematocida minor]KAI5190388.1 hypothetical protein NEMIN01_1012 [Nematocida minor]